MASIGRTPGGVEIAAWILKGDPRVFDLDGALDSNGKVDSWSVHQSYRTGLMAHGQRCFLWRSGPDGALVAGGLVTGPAASGLADPNEWEDRAKARTAELFVPVELLPLDAEIPRDVLRDDPVLSRMELFRSPRMSNPNVVTPGELEAIEEYLQIPEGWDGGAEDGMGRTRSSRIVGSDEFALQSGRVIKLASLEQRQWIGPLDGAPNTEMCEAMVRDNAARYGASAGFYLVQPPIIPLSSSWDGHPKQEPMRLPWVVVVASFVSDYPAGPVNESGWDKSHLQVLWYQDEWALPIDSAVYEEILSVDWESLAVDVVMPY
jgi:hypothetical protein